MKKLMLTLAVTMAFTPLAFAADAPAAAKSTPMPAYGKDKPIPTPKIVKKTLANGMTVWVVPRDGLPRVDFVLAVRGAGYAADDKAHPGFASLLAGMLNEGTAKRDSRAIAEAAQGLGGSVAASPANDGILVSANALTSQAADMMSLLAEVTRVPSFPAKEVDLAKANALQALRVSETTPRFRAERAINEAIYGNHPYGHTEPTAEAITSVTQDMLRAEHAKRFRPDRALLVITGRVSEAEAMKMAQAAFGDWKAQGPALAEAAPAPANAKPARILLQRGGSVQSTIRVGAPGIAASAADQVPLRLASTILGGGFSSRVNINLREEKGYTYGASAGARMSRAGGAIIGGADVRNEVTGAALLEYFNEYKRIGTDLVPAAEMTMNKRYVAGGYLISNQLQRAVAGTLAQNWLVGLPPEFLGQYVPLIEKVTPAQVRDVSKKYFAPEKQAIVVVGDPAAVGEQLKQFGEFTVTDR
ncbi:pitrilysin family protein [Massilia sp. YIM B02769]|uniref:M16 family metallopeptidase n=1 Tax=unclassified Massilia TaxID=2609279 RepID=UPI0025B726AA|nr:MULTISPECIES: pitrilysin family protein [unclassified Massilia]MDN4058780.1 pitrilysin family protein [Massilia sp. YIM B02769]